MTENKNNAPVKSMPEKKMSSGVVMLYKRDDGYGFIRPDAGGDDIYFSIHAVEGSQIPAAGDKVEFTISSRRPRNGKSARAQTVRIVVKKESGKARQDDRITCPHCGRKVVPRIRFYQGSPEASYCPFCAGLIKDFRVPYTPGFFEKILTWIFSGFFEKILTWTFAGVANVVTLVFFLFLLAGIVGIVGFAGYFLYHGVVALVS